MNTHEPELAAAVQRMEAVQRYIEQLAPAGTDLGAAYAELDAAVREYEVVPKWREASASLAGSRRAGETRPD